MVALAVPRIWPVAILRGSAPAIGIRFVSKFRRSLAADVAFWAPVVKTLDVRID
jgi:hypothetical protein